MKKHSESLNSFYEMEGKLYICNTRQAGLYIANGARLYDIFWSTEKNVDGTLVFVFSRKDTKELYDLWCKRELIPPEV